MPSLDPKPGQVIRYAYLWHSEAKAGREEGAKDRPCVITYTKQNQDGTKTVGVSPITHAKQEEQGSAVPIPIKTAKRLGLDDRQSYIVTNQYNRFTWPGPDIRAADPKSPEKGPLIDHLPAKLAEAVRGSMSNNQKTRQLKHVGRDKEPSERLLEAKPDGFRARHYPTPRSEKQTRSKHSRKKGKDGLER